MQEKNVKSRNSALLKQKIFPGHSPRGCPQILYETGEEVSGGAKSFSHIHFIAALHLNKL